MQLRRCYVLIRPPSRLCGTRNCTLLDGHEGGHSTELNLGRRRPSTSKGRHPVRSTPAFQWDALDLDLQAYVLMHLAANEVDLVWWLFSIACHFRPLKKAITRLLHLDSRMCSMMNKGWSASACKCTQRDDVTCTWRDAFAGGEHIHLAEYVYIKLSLSWKCTPRCWCWQLGVDWFVEAPCGRYLRTDIFRALLGASTQLCVPNESGHRMHRVRGGVPFTITAKPSCLQRFGVHCQNKAPLVRSQVTSSVGTLRVQSSFKTLVEWTIPPDALGVMHLVSALL